MYKSSQNYTKDTFKVELETDNGESIRISVLPPKINVLRKFAKIDDKSAESLDETTDIMAEMLSKNREKRIFSSEEIGELLDIYDMQELVKDFVNWIDNTKKK